MKKAVTSAAILALLAGTVSVANAEINTNTDPSKGPVLSAGLFHSTKRAAADVGVRTALKTKLSTDNQLEGSNISIDVKKGKVTLTGAVNNQAQLNRAVSIAKSQEGVTKVINKLTVTRTSADSEGLRRAGDKVEDGTISNKVRAKLLAEGIYDDATIDVTTLNDAVVLTGTIGTAAKAARAVELAQQTAGVTKVINKLQVQQK